MDFRIRDIAPADLAALPALNDAEIPHVNALDGVLLDFLSRESAYFRVAERAGTLAGFLIALGPGADYQSPNYRWFHDRYPRFAYVDRIVVAAAARGRGVGRALYADLEDFSRDRAPILACEVNIRPSNERSLRFHQRCGFAQVGTQQTEGGAKEVALMVKLVEKASTND